MIMFVSVLTRAGAFPLMFCLVLIAACFTSVPVAAQPRTVPRTAAPPSPPPAAAPAPASARDDNAPLRPGEAFVTRFSGTTAAQGAGATLNPEGTVGSIVDLRNPGQPPNGQHWIDEPQRKPVTAAQVGQVFGVVLDDANPPNIYLAATSAFGLHRSADGAQWMPGMWGPNGPGGVYRLDAMNGYAPRPFARIGANNRPNGGAALGNLAYDRGNKQLFVSDLETGMIHRLRAADGSDLGTYDHGSQGRANFMDVASGQTKSLPPIVFDPASSAQLNNCPAKFDTSPQCWNFAASGRRVWGLGVHHDPRNNESRLFYAVWSGPSFGQPSWNQAAEDDKRNSVWSVRLGPDGNFDPANVRREFVLPDFFVKPEDIARAGYSHPVSDITFAECGPRPIMLLAERGGIRNLGLGAQDAFAYPHEARALRYELDQKGAWRPVGRYDVGFYERKKEGSPLIRANCSGGAAFGPGYEQAGAADPKKPDQFVWITGDYLCSPEGPCNLPGPEGEAAQQAAAPPPAPAAATPPVQPAAMEVGAGTQPDDSQVHGVQGTAEGAFAEVLPAAALAVPPPQGDATVAAGLNQSYLIDTDINVDESGGLIDEELARNDATKIGDIAVYQPCEPLNAYAQNFLMAPPPPGGGDETVTLAGHPPDASHAFVASHGRESSHFRFGSHNPSWSHGRFGSHNQFWSHNREGSHNAVWSHNRWGSHTRQLSHARTQSHTRAISHWRTGSHDARLSHRRAGSHNPELSHSRQGSHNARISHARLGSHNLVLSHGRVGSHNQQLSHSRTGSHTPALSHARTRSHNLALSHTRTGSHARERSHAATGSHNKQASHLRTGSHRPQISQGQTHRPPGSHVVAISRGQTHRPPGSHVPAASQAQQHRPPGSHAAALSQGQTHRPPGSHVRAISQGQTRPTHAPAVSSQRPPVHAPAASGARQRPAHAPAASAPRAPAHAPAASAPRPPAHAPAVSAAQRRPVHAPAASAAARPGPKHDPRVSRQQQPH
jgi:hypothetical protein